MNNQVVIYSADWCGDCRRAKSWMTANGVPFVEIDVENDDAQRDRAVELAGGRKNIPVVVLPDGDVLVEPTNSELAAAFGVAVA
ncbi:glutaredoxin family protein [Actinokineospora xionganensis]|uniref:Glutaredoxin family protein n=1 Tax=Actinokineospora xionganensis TaxID=2684470 RepID=A0ABR7L500_9PSEU|nr:glutaredoxin family protein [Actinokineospora xionganensis]MBC6447729.1 glutaredoxin family protein [Actinokineospora xionganensis]